MAIFDPEPQAQGEPNYIHYSRGVGKPEANLTGTEMVKGITNIFDSAVKATDFTFKENIREGLQSKVKDELSPLLDPMVEQGKAIGSPQQAIDQYKAQNPQQAGDILLHPGGEVPPGLNDFKGAVSKLQQANNAGVISQPYINSRLEGIVRDAKNQYPGYGDYIDRTIHEITGIKPANALMADLFAQSEAAKGNAQKERDSRVNFVKTEGQYLRNYPDLVKGILDGSRSLEEGAYRVAQERGNEWQLDRGLKQIQYDQAQGKQDKETYDKQATLFGNDHISSVITQMYNTATGGQSLQDIQSQIHNARMGTGPMPDAKQIQTMNDQLGAQMSSAREFLRQEYNRPRKELGGNSFSSILGPDAINKKIDEVLQPLKDIHTDIGGQNLGLAHASSNIIAVSRDQGIAKMMPMGPYLTGLSVIRHSGGEQAAGIAMTNADFMQGVTNEMKGLLNHAQVTTLGGQTTGNDVAKKYKEFSQARPDDAKAVPFSTFMDKIIQPALAKDTPPEMFENFAKAFFGQGNQAWMTNFKDTPEKMQLWSKLTSPEITQKMIELGKTNPQLLKDYQNWAKNEFSTAFSPYGAKLNSIYLEGTVPQDAKFNPQTSQFEYHELTAPSGPYRESLDTLNIALNNLHNVFAINHNEAQVKDFISDTIQRSLGVNPDLPKPTLLKSLSDAVSNTLQKGGEAVEQKAKGQGDTKISPLMYDQGAMRAPAIDAINRAIGKAEPDQANSYNTMYKVKNPPNFSDMTVNEVLKYQQDKSKETRSTAAVGYFQFIGPTLKSLIKEAGLTGEEKFTPQLQNRLGEMLMERRGLSQYMEGKMHPEDFADSLAKEWAGLPTRTGKSYYEGVGGNHATISRRELMDSVNSIPRKAPDGNYYVRDPDRPGKFLRVLPPDLVPNEEEQSSPQSNIPSPIRLAEAKTTAEYQGRPGLPGVRGGAKAGRQSTFHNINPEMMQDNEKQ